jgi:hypothetical protein
MASDEWIIGEVRDGVCYVECYLCHHVREHYDSTDWDHSYDDADDVFECNGHLKPICGECADLEALPAEVRVEEGL